jgi:Na+/serine symporter
VTGLGNGRPRDPGESRLLFKLRIGATVTIGCLLVFVLVTDTLGRLFVDPDFHIDEFIWGSLLGTFMLVAGVTTVAGLKLPGGWEVRRQAEILPGGVKVVSTDDIRKDLPT